MYLNGQIVHSLSKKSPVQVGDPNFDAQFAWTNVGCDTTHYIACNPDYDPWTGEGDRYIISTPSSIEEAAELLTKGLIQPAPRAPRLPTRTDA